MSKKTTRSFLALVFLLLTTVLVTGCRPEGVTGYSTPGPTPQPSALPTEAAISDPLDVVQRYFAIFNNTVSGQEPQSRYAQMYTLFVHSSDPCNKDRFIAMQGDIKLSVGSYNTTDPAKDNPVLKSSDGMTATVRYEVSSVGGRGIQSFNLVKQGGGYLVKELTDELNGENYNWPPKPDAGWQSQVMCASSGSGTGGASGTPAAAGSTPGAGVTTTPLALKAIALSGAQCIAPPSCCLAIRAGQAGPPPASWSQLAPRGQRREC